MGNDTPITDALKAKTLEAGIADYKDVILDWFSACHKLETDRAELIAALEPFAALRQPHQDLRRPEYPIFGINGADITLADLDRARSVLSRVRA